MACAALAMLSAAPAAAETWNPALEFQDPRNFVFDSSAGPAAAPVLRPNGAYRRPISVTTYDGYYLQGSGPSALLSMHPTNKESVRLRFIAPRAGSYTFTGHVTVGDLVNGTGIGVTVTGSARRVLTISTSRADISTTLQMTAGQSFQIEVDSAGADGYDITRYALTVTGPDAPADWTRGDWSAYSSTCGAATRTRTVTCTDLETGGAVSDSRCQASTRPAATEDSHQISGCTHSWSEGAWSSPVPACGSSSQTRTVTCRRSDGQDVDPSNCTGEAPATRQAATDHSACTYSWTVGEWSQPGACGTSTTTRDVGCNRSDTTPAAPELCDAATRPASSQTVEVTIGCSYRWTETETGPWSACQSGTQTRRTSYACVRSDGLTAANASCSGAVPEGTESRSCTMPQDPARQVVVFRRPLTNLKR
jgi:hypothetical protein